MPNRDYDVVVCGGGAAGVSAALAAARSGMSVMLIEKLCCLGGLATSGNINWWEPSCDELGTKLIGGISEELLRRTIALSANTLPECWQRAGVWKQQTRERMTSWFSPSVMALVMQEMLAEAGVTLRFDALATRPLMAGTRVYAMACETVSGTERFHCGAVVDATGSCIVFDRAGAPCETGANYQSYYVHMQRFEDVQPESMRKSRAWHISGANFAGTGQPEGLPLIPGVAGDEVSRFIQRGQHMLYEELRGWNRDAQEIISLPQMPQLRMIRHITGAYSLTMADDHQRHEDSIGVCGYFHHPGCWFELPYGTLYTPGFPNLFAAGRIISARGGAWDATRVIPAAALTGEAAGTAAALSVLRGCTAEKLEVGALQAQLAGRGNRIHFEQDMDNSGNCR